MRVQNFLLQSLKQLTLKLLREMPMYKAAPKLLAQGLTVTGELNNVT